MNKRWTDQKYVIYFLLSAMVLGVCGGVSYEASCCLGGELRSKEAELAWAADESDERYVAYTASEQRVIAVEQLAYNEDYGERAQAGADAAANENAKTGAAGQNEGIENTHIGGGTESEGQAVEGAGTPSQAAVGLTADTAVPANAGAAADTAVSVNAGAAEDTVVSVNAGAAADTDTVMNADLAAHAGTDMSAGEAGDIDASVNGGVETAGAAGEDTNAEPQTENGADVQANGYVIAVSDGDYEALLRIVQAEAGNEDTKGKILVANVVLNRVADERFPNTVYDVVFQRSGGKAQFSPVASGSYYKVVVTDDTIEAVERALAGEDYSEGALFFAARRYAGSSQMRWFDECLTKLFSYGGHEFFTS